MVHNGNLLETTPSDTNKLLTDTSHKDNIKLPTSNNSEHSSVIDSEASTLALVTEYSANEDAKPGPFMVAHI